MADSEAMLVADWTPSSQLQTPEAEQQAAETPNSAKHSNKKRDRSSFNELKDSYYNKLRVVEKHIGQLVTNFSKATFLQAIDADLAKIPHPGTAAQQAERSRLQDERAGLLEPELFYIVQSPFIGDNFYWRSAAFEADHLLQKSSHNLLDSFSNSAERTRLLAVLPEAIPAIPLCATAPQPTPKRHKVRTRPPSFVDDAKRELRKLWRIVYDRTAQLDGNGNKTGNLPLCPPEQYNFCRDQDGEFPCGGTCQAARQAMRWPCSAPLIHLNNKAKDYIVAHMDTILRHYAANEPALLAHFNVPERKAVPAGGADAAPSPATTSGVGRAGSEAALATVAICAAVEAASGEAAAAEVASAAQAAEAAEAADEDDMEVAPAPSGPDAAPEEPEQDN